jgi:hypothetical protein
MLILFYAIRPICDSRFFHALYSSLKVEVPAAGIEEVASHSAIAAGKHPITERAFSCEIAARR